MKKIYIDKKMSDVISIEIAKLVKKYNNNDNLQAINMLVYQKFNFNVIIELIFITKELENIFESVKYNNWIKIKAIDDLEKKYYNELDEIKYNDRMMDLYNGYLLYDRDGKYKKLKEKITNIYISKNEDEKRKYYNSVEFKPELKKLIKS